MQSLSELIETAVLTVLTGKQIGVVEEVVISLDRALVIGIIINHDTWFSAKRFIPFEDIYRIGFDAVMVRNEDVGEKFDDHMIDNHTVYGFKYLRGKQIFAESGRQLGTMADVDFDYLTGELKGYRVSDGMISDFLYGRANLPLPHAQLICDDRVILPESMVKLLQQ